MLTFCPDEVLVANVSENVLKLALAVENGLDVLSGCIHGCFLLPEQVDKLVHAVGQRSERRRSKYCTVLNDCFTTYS